MPNAVSSCPICKGDRNRVVESFTTEEFCLRFEQEHSSSVHSLMEPLLRTLREEHPREYQLCQCDACGLTAAHPMVGGSSEFYRLLYKGMPDAEARWEYGVFLDTVARNACILDVGCGDGAFLAMVRSRGIKAWGLDFNPEFGGSSSVDGIAYIPIDGLGAFLEGRPEFDVFTLWHVLEHLSDPVGTLALLRRSARKDGKLAIAVPSDRFFMTCRAERPITDFPPHHLTRWTRESLRRAGEITGWTMVDHRYQPLGGALKLYALRMVKAGATLRHVGQALMGRQLTDRVLDSVWDETPTSTMTKVRASFWLAVLSITAGRCSGLSQYALFVPSE